MVSNSKQLTPDYVFEQDDSFNIADDFSDVGRFTSNMLRNIEERKRKPVPLIITDMDEVLVHITFKWVTEFAKQYTHVFLERGLTMQQIEEELLNPMNILSRTDYYVNLYMGIAQESEYFPKFLGLYRDTEFYDSLTPTSFGEAIHELASSGKAKMHIISHCMAGPDSPSTKSKVRFIEKYFPKATYTLTSNKVPKSRVINDENLNDYDIFVDDLLDHVEDVFLHTNSIGKEYNVPSYGYNSNFQRLVDPMSRNLSRLNFFDIE